MVLSLLSVTALADDERVSEGATLGDLIEFFEGIIASPIADDGPDGDNTKLWATKYEAEVTNKPAAAIKLFEAASDEEAAEASDDGEDEGTEAKPDALVYGVTLTATGLKYRGNNGDKTDPGEQAPGNGPFAFLGGLAFPVKTAADAKVKIDVQTATIYGDNAKYHPPEQVYHHL